MPFRVVRNDIVNMPVDAIVNAANSTLAMGGGVCGAIFRAAGSREMTEACRYQGYCNTGEAVYTPGFRLHARHVIHTVGPVWQDGNHGEPEQLANCYRNSLELAAELGDESVAFPLISAGIYGYPLFDALDVAIRSIRIFLASHDNMNVFLVLYDFNSTLAAKGLINDIQYFIDDVYVENAEDELRRQREMADMLLPDEGARRDFEAAGVQPDESTLRRRMNAEFLDPTATDVLDRSPSFAEPQDSAPDLAHGAEGFMPLPSLSRTDFVGTAAPAQRRRDEDVQDDWGDLLEDQQWGGYQDEGSPERDVYPTGQAASPYTPEKRRFSSRIGDLFRSMGRASRQVSPKEDLNNLMVNLDASFSETLLQLIDESGMADSVVYKRANMSRQHFSKIRSQPGYRPKKQTVLALAIALELDLEDCEVLLERAGYALSHADKRDVIVEYFIRRGNYDVFDINCALYDFDQPLLG